MTEQHTNEESTRDTYVAASTVCLMALGEIERLEETLAGATSLPWFRTPVDPVTGWEDLRVTGRDGAPVGVSQADGEPAGFAPADAQIMVAAVNSFGLVLARTKRSLTMHRPSRHYTCNQRCWSYDPDTGANTQKRGWPCAAASRELAIVDAAVQ